MTDQNTVRGSVEVGPGFDKVTPVSWWYRKGAFKSDDEARGAFRLAYVQALDGMGTGIAQWMGLTDSEAAEWMRNERLPGKPIRGDRDDRKPTDSPARTGNVTVCK
jgi:hypothetical protein